MNEYLKIGFKGVVMRMFFSFVVLVVVGSFVAQKVLKEEEKVETEVLYSLVTMQVKGMTCDHCARSITTTLTKNPGVKNVIIDVKDGKIVFANKIKGQLDEKKIRNLIESLGYEVISFKETLS